MQDGRLDTIHLLQRLNLNWDIYSSWTQLSDMAGVALCQELGNGHLYGVRGVSLASDPRGWLLGALLQSDCR
jgi:hypothetical protein